MPSRKRGHDEVDQSEVDSTPSLLQRVRNCWQFASLMQYIHIFGDAAKIPEDVDVDVLEEECLRVPSSDRLTEIGLCMLRMVSSHRGLTPEIFDEYTRRQYVAKAPHRNPFGEDETPVRFADMDIFTRLTVLHQLSVWTFFNEDRMRDRMPEKENTEQLNWRIDPAGWDSDDREYYVLDDNRLYRLTRPALPPPPPKKSKAKSKAKPKKAPPPKARGSRSSKRQRLLNGDHDDEDEDEDDFMLDARDEQEAAPEPEAQHEPTEPEDNGLGGAKWELLAITLEEYRAVMEPFRKSRDINEKNLYKYLEQNSLPALERAAASHARKAAARQRELEALAKMANAKRSSRISSRQQQIKEAEEAVAAARRKKEELAEAHREQERQAKIEAERESRMMTREQRIKDREMKRILHEEELEKLRAGSEQSDGQEGRISERNRKAKLEKSQKELDQLKEEEENWDFDCAVCGVHGRNLDDGTHSMACEKCGVWQHSACHGISEAKAESDDFHFVCAACSKPKPPKVKLEDKPQSQAVNGHATSQSKPAQGLSAPLPNGQQHIPAQPAGQPTHYPHVPHQHHSGINGHANGNGVARPGQYPAPNLPRPYVPPSWHAPPSPSKPLTPSNQHLSHTSSANSSFTPQAYRQSPSFDSRTGGASPTPSLSATQGNTNVRFSPTQQRHGTFGGSQAYTPVSDLPNAAAYSPTKKVGSSPPQPQVGRLHSPLGTGTGVSPYALNAGPTGTGQPPSSQASIIPGAAGGVSPVKHDVASSPAPAPGHLQQPAPAVTGLGISQYNLPKPVQADTSSQAQQGTAPGSSFDSVARGMSMNALPNLSPSVNTGMANLGPPRKKSPEFSAPALPPLNIAGHAVTGGFKGLQQQQQQQPHGQ